MLKTEMMETRIRGVGVLGSRYLSLSSKMVCLRGGQGPDRKWPGTTPSSALKAVRGLLAKRRKCFAGFCGSVVLVACADADSAWHAQPGTPPSPHNSLDFRGRIGSSSHCDWKLPRAWAEDRGANALDGAWKKEKNRSTSWRRCHLTRVSEARAEFALTTPTQSGQTGQRSSTRPLPLLEVTIPKLRSLQAGASKSSRRLKMSGSRDLSTLFVDIWSFVDMG